MADRPVRSAPPSSSPSSGTDYSSVQNPYSTQFMKQTGWDKLLNALGFRSSYDEAEALRQQNYAIWQSQYNEMQRQEQYNSAAAQVERQREAGLNPDINGNVDSGQSSDGPAANYADMAGAFTKGSEQFGKFMQGVSTALQSALSVATGIPDVQGKMLNNALTELGFLDKLPGIGETLFDLSVISGIDVDTMDFTRNPTGSEMSLISSELYNSIPKKYRRAIGEYINQYKDSAKGKARSAELKGKEITNVANAYDKLPSLASSYGNKELLDPLSELASELGEIQINTIRSEMKARRKLMDKLHIDNYEQYAREYEANKAAFNAQAAQAASAEYQAANSKIIFGALNQIFEKLDEQIKKGGITGFLSSAALSTLGAVATGLIPNVSFSGSTGSSEKNLYESHSKNQSKSFGISF